MFEKVFIFPRNESIHQIIGQFIARYIHPVMICQGAYPLAVAIICGTIFQRRQNLVQLILVRPPCINEKNDDESDRNEAEPQQQTAQIARQQSKQIIPSFTPVFHFRVQSLNAYRASGGKDSPSCFQSGNSFCRRPRYWEASDLRPALSKASAALNRALGFSSASLTNSSAVTP